MVTWGRKSRAFILAGALCVGCTGTDREVAPASVLRASVEAMGTDAELAALGAIAMYASGTLDKAAEGQGFSPMVPAPGPYMETIGVDPSGSAALWDYREERFDGTFENFGESYPTPELKNLLIHDVGVAVPLRGSSVDQDRARVRRRIPPMLVRELLARPDSLRLLAGSEDVRRVQASLGDGEAVIVSVDAATSFVRELTYEQVIPGRGPALVRWWYADYREAFPGVWLPMRYGSAVDSLEYTTMIVDSVRPRSPAMFDPPEGLRVLEVRDAPQPSDPDPLELRRLAPGLFAVPDVRSGFAPLVVEFEDFLVAVDAPASFPLLGQIPAAQTDPAVSMSWQSERFVDLLTEHWPEKPISYLVLTHHHEDHVGGVRAFVAVGATIMGPRSAIEVAERLANLPPDVIDDRLAASPQNILVEIVEESRRLTDGSQVIDLIPVEDNPHADEMLIVSVPGPAIVYVSDLLTPGSLDAYPSSSHRALDDFFGRWLAESGLDPGVVWTIHGDEPLTRRHLALLRSEPGSSEISTLPP